MLAESLILKFNRDIKSVGNAVEVRPLVDGQEECSLSDSEHCMQNSFELYS